MTTQVTATNTYTTHRVTANVTGAAPLSHPWYSHSAKLVIPDWIGVEYEINSSDQWTVTSMRMAGMRLKSDGTPSQQRTVMNYYHDSVLPQWAVDFIAANTPTLAKPRPPVPPPGVDHACCQVCGWRGLETETKVLWFDDESTETIARCPKPECRSTDLCYFAPSGVRRLS